MTHFSGPVEISVVMPCLNEAETIAICIKKASACCETLQVAFEIIIADNGSTDGSQALARELGARVIDVPAKGYGSALMGGIDAAQGTCIIMGDADDSYDFSNLAPFIEKLRMGYDLVMGNRFKGGIRAGAMPPLHKYLGNPVLTGIGKLLFKSPVGDFHCGLRGFRKDAIASLDLRTTGMEFASEMVVKATLQKLNITEVPTTLSPDGRSRPPHLRSWRDGWRHLRFMLLYSPRWLFFYPGIFLIAAGIVTGAWLLPGPRSFGGITLDVHTLLYAAMAIIIGYQSITFALFTKIFAIMEGLRPEDKTLNKLFEFITLETGLCISCVLIIAGCAGSLFALTYWGERSFGDIDPSQALRIVIPASTLLAIGFQTFLASFFLSILGLRRR
jgi:glycosyltransferase involved in cell wall biosynthesis